MITSPLHAMFMMNRHGAPTMSQTKKGRPATLGDHRVYSMRVPPDLHRALKVYSAQHGPSMNALIVHALLEWWNDGNPRSMPAPASGAEEGASDAGVGYTEVRDGGKIVRRPPFPSTDRRPANRRPTLAKAPPISPKERPAPPTRRPVPPTRRPGPPPTSKR